MWKFSAARLKELRALTGMSMETFSKAIGKSGPTVLNWEKGRGAPSGHDLATIGNRFQIDPCSFFLKTDK